MRRAWLIAFLVFTVALTGCAEDKKPTEFDLGDAPLADGTSPDDTAVTSCFGHDDCAEDELCFESECRDRDDVLAFCDEDEDCPVDFVCVEQQCEEE